MKHFKLWKILLPAIILLLIGLVGIYVRGIFSNSRLSYAVKSLTVKTAAARLPEERAAARKAGLPLTPADLKASAAVSSGDNAAPLYRQAFSHLDRMSKTDTTLVGDYLKPANRTAKRRQEIQILMATLQPLFPVTHQASLRPHCDWGRTGINTVNNFPEGAKMRLLARLFAVRSIREAESGKPEAALQSVEVGARIARHAGDEPGLIPALVQIAIRTIQHRQFVAILKQYGDRPKTLRAAHRTHDAFGAAPQLRGALRGEMLLSVQQTESLAADPASGARLLNDNRYVKVPLKQRSALADAYQVRLLEFWQATFAILDKTSNDKLRLYQELKQFEEREEQRGRNDPTYLVNAILTPVVHPAVLVYLKVDAENHLRATMVTLLEERKRTGQFPPGITGKVPTERDPFDNAPLRYKRVGNGFLLYSVGRNLKDDDGISRPAVIGTRKSKEGGPDDIVISYP